MTDLSRTVMPLVRQSIQQRFGLSAQLPKVLLSLSTVGGAQSAGIEKFSGPLGGWFDHGTTQHG